MFMFSLIRRESKTVSSQQRHVTDWEQADFRYFRLETDWRKALQSSNVNGRHKSSCKEYVGQKGSLRLEDLNNLTDGPALPIVAKS